MFAPRRRHDRCMHRGVAAVVAFTSPDVIVATAKDVVPVEVEDAPMVPPLIRRTP